jgi:hypothetical protein
MAYMYQMYRSQERSEEEKAAIQAHEGWKNIWRAGLEATGEASPPDPGRDHGGGRQDATPAAACHPR